jgi:hypothetical protein
VLILLGISFLLRDLFILQGMKEASALYWSFLIVGAIVGGIGAILITKALNTLKENPLLQLKPRRPSRKIKNGSK